MANYISIEEAIKKNGGFIVHYEMKITNSFGKYIYPETVDENGVYNIHWLGIINHKVLTYGAFVNRYDHEDGLGIISIEPLTEKMENYYNSLPEEGKCEKTIYMPCNLINKDKMSKIIKLIKDIQVTNKIPEGYETRKEIRVELFKDNTLDFKDISLDVGKWKDKTFYSINFEDNKFKTVKEIEKIAGNAYDEEYSTETNKYYEEETYKDDEFELYVNDEVYKMFKKDERDYELNIDGLIIKITNRDYYRR